MNLFNKHIWCSYKQLYFDRLEIFEGKEVTVKYLSDYRICRDCNKIQIYSYDSQGGTWVNLPNNKQEAVREAIRANKYHD